MGPQRDNVKAGVFVLLGIALAVAVVIVLADFSALFATSKELRVYYSLGDGLQGLKPGARVNLGGQPVGEVRRIDDYTQPGGDHIEGQIVTIAVPSRVKIYWNARVEVDKPPLGTNTTMNIASVGSGEISAGDRDPAGKEIKIVVPLYDGAQAIPDQVYRLAFPDHRVALDLKSPMRPVPAGTLPGMLAGTTLTRSLTQDIGIGELQRRQIAEIIDKLHSSVTQFEKKVPKLAEMIDNLHDVTVTLRKEVPQIAQQVERTLTKAETIVDDAKLAMGDVKAATKKADEVVADVQKRSQKWLKDIDDVTSAASDGVARLRDLIKDKDPVVREAIDNLRSVTHTARTETMGQIQTALKNGNDALESLRVGADGVKEFVVGQRPVLERAVANVQLGTAQFKLALIEVRRSPWRLLYTPDEKELEADKLYDAARSFAEAASTLDAAAQSLQAVAKQDPKNEARIKRMLDDLQSLFGRYREAEDKFWGALKDAPKPK